MHNQLVTAERFHEVLRTVGNVLPGSIRLVDHMGSDLDIVRAARVSYAAEARAGEDEKSDFRLINYLMKNHHTTPFEMVQFKFEIKAPIFVFRQWHRHRTWSVNEMSGRYVELDEGFYVPDVGDYGTQNASNKQMRDIGGKTSIMTPEEIDRDTEWQREQTEFMLAAFDLYRRHVAEGMPRELARAILPCATYSRMQASIDLHNLLHFIRLRSHSHAQYEIRVYSDAMLAMIEPVVPVAVAAFRKHILNQG